MTQNCRACGGTVCIECGGCIQHGECSCIEERVAEKIVPALEAINELIEFLSFDAPTLAQNRRWWDEDRQRLIQKTRAVVATYEQYREEIEDDKL